MNLRIGIRREDKNKWERRVPLSPTHVQHLQHNHAIHTLIQPSPIRVFSDDKYRAVNATITEDLSSTSIIFAVKEIPLSFFEEKKTYVFFSHTIKGQSSNMPMLQHMLDLKCTLIDYERIIDESGKRLVFFGRYAGIAGMVDTLWGFGQRLRHENITSPLTEIKQTIRYGTIDAIKNHFHEIHKKLLKTHLPSSIHPIVIGIAGYGNVSQGAQEILDILPIKEITPSELSSIHKYSKSTYLYKVVFKEQHMFSPRSNIFNLQDYYQHPERYYPIFEQYLPHLTILMNCIYWDTRYPRLITKKWIQSQDLSNLKLNIIGDISVDINGAIEITEKVTNPDNPCFVYSPHNDSIKEDLKEKGVAVMAIDNLPCELPRASSLAFSKALVNLVPSLAKTDYKQSYDKLTLPKELQHAMILHQGKLTPEYRYIDKYL